MKHWNYRIIRFGVQEEDEHYLAIHTVYYIDGQPVTFSDEAAVITSEDCSSVNGLKAELWAFNAALHKPVLNACDFAQGGADYSVDGDLQ